MDDETKKGSSQAGNEPIESNDPDKMLDLIQKELKVKREAAKREELLREDVIRPKQTPSPQPENRPKPSVTAETDKTQINAPIVRPDAGASHVAPQNRRQNPKRAPQKEKVVYFDDIDEGARKKNLAASAKREEEEKADKEIRKSFLGLRFNSGLKLVLYIVFVALSVFLLSTTIINVSNDVFAFVKSDKEITVKIPKNATTHDVAKILKKNKIVRYQGVFEMFTKFRMAKRTYLSGKYISGNHVVRPNMNYDDLIETLALAQQRGVVRITIPEGLTVNETMELLIEKGVRIDKEKFIDALQNYAFDYRFISEMKDLSSYRKDSNYSYRLEGYLFPDTYDFYTDESAVSIIDKLLATFNKKFEEQYYDRCRKLGMTVDQLITLASMIEGEAGTASDFPTVSSVFHNRLNNAGTYPYLESDATIQYSYQVHKKVLTAEDVKRDHPYNTYLYKGLPPGPICNPGIEAIVSALYPADSNYYYFVSSDGKTEFSKTYAEHQKAIADMKATQTQ